MTLRNRVAEVRRHISEDTGVTDLAMLARIEDYMRNIIFHSTLDWQTAAQLKCAARTAARELPMLDAMIAADHAKVQGQRTEETF